MRRPQKLRVKDANEGEGGMNETARESEEARKRERENGRAGAAATELAEAEQHIPVCSAACRVIADGRHRRCAGASKQRCCVDRRDSGRIGSHAGDDRQARHHSCRRLGAASAAPDAMRRVQTSASGGSHARHVLDALSVVLRVRKAGKRCRARARAFHADSLARARVQPVARSQAKMYECTTRTHRRATSEIWRLRQKHKSAYQSSQTHEHVQTTARARAQKSQTR
eukprot:6199820-Pleurochrysis_carterae.AAC.1